MGGNCPYTYITGPITANCTVTFSLAAVTHTVTPQTDGNGSVNPSTAQTVNDGNTASFTVGLYKK